MYQPSHLIIADTQILVTEGLKVLLNKVFGKISQANSMEELDQLLRQNPDSLLIVDYALSEMGSCDNLNTIRNTFPAAGIIVLSNHYNQPAIADLNRVGIIHILDKSVDRGELIACIEAVKKGRRYYSAFVLDVMMETKNKKDTTLGGILLTPAETEIVKLIAEGLTNKQIAQRKTLSIHTIMTHRKNILRKLEVSSASELIMIALKKGWIDVIDYQI